MMMMEEEGGSGGQQENIIILWEPGHEVFIQPLASVFMCWRHRSSSAASILHLLPPAGGESSLFHVMKLKHICNMNLSPVILSLHIWGVFETENSVILRRVFGGNFSFKILNVKSVMKLQKAHLLLRKSSDHGGTFSNGE